MRLRPLGDMSLRESSQPSPVASPELVDGCMWFPINGMVNVQATSSAGFSVVSHNPRLDVGQVESVRFWVDHPAAALRSAQTP